jgi:hypothetical protein
MDVIALIEAAKGDGVEFRVVDGELEIEAAAGMRHWVKELRPHKDEILQSLTESNGDEPNATTGDTALMAYMAYPDDLVATDDPWPEPLDDAAYHGLAGEITATVEPHSEADPVAILSQLLIAFGNVIGRNAHFRAEADRHYGNLFEVLVGDTSKGRKGTSWGQVSRLLEPIDAEWRKHRVIGGLSSGEGLIWAVRDPVRKLQPIHEGKGKDRRIVGHEETIVDEGIEDKRLLVMEGEFSAVLKVASRQTNTISAVIRQAWDTGSLRILTKNSPAQATDAHISIIGHITRDELRRLITDTDLANGLANRFLWLAVRRSKCLPEGGALRESDRLPLVQRLNAAVEFAAGAGEMRRDDAARAIWNDVYAKLTDGSPGLLGAATSRAEAQVMRLAMLYALLDLSPEIRSEHLLAGLAVWTYAEQSARYIFGGALGDPVADSILTVLRHRHPDGMSRNDIREHFGRNKSAEEITRALTMLLEHHLVRREMQETAGRPAEVFFVRV